MLNPDMPVSQLRLHLADYAHNAWSGWMDYLFGLSTKSKDGSVKIPGSLVKRWERQAATQYCDLPPNEQVSDLAEADKMLEIFMQSNDLVAVVPELLPDTPAPLAVVEGKVVIAGEAGCDHWAEIRAACKLPEGTKGVVIFMPEGNSHD